MHKNQRLITLPWVNYYPAKPTPHMVSFQTSYLDKERNIAPWEVAHDAFIFVANMLLPETENEDSDVLHRFVDWVNNLVMPYFYGTGGFRMVGGESEEEMQLKVKMVDFACNRWGLKPCLVDAQKQFFDWMDGKEEIHSYLRPSILKAALASIDTRVGEVYTFFKGNPVVSQLTITQLSLIQNKNGQQP